MEKVAPDAALDFVKNLVRDMLAECEAVANKI